MANPLRDDNPDDGEQPQQGRGGIFGRWQDWLSEPENSAALIGFGAQMMQPRQAGQTPLGQFGMALGTGGEAAANIQKQGMAERELESKETQRESAAALAEQKARAAGDTAYYRQQHEALMEEVHPANAYFQHQQAIVKQNKMIDDANEKGQLNATPGKPFTPTPHEPILTYPEFLEQRFPRLVGRGGVGIGAGQDPTRGTNGTPLDPSDVQALRANPSRARDFDTHYGQGTAAQILQKRLKTNAQ